jgi:hypothetical protein
MAMLGEYVMVDEDTLDRMMAMNGAELLETLEKRVEDGGESYEIDKLWDNLHLVLTGVSASEPIEGDPLSEAVVGVHVFELEEEEGFFACTEHDELEAIIQAMKQVDFAALKPRFEALDFRSPGLDPVYGEKPDKDILWEELKREFAALLAFYEQALSIGHHVIFSVV